MKSKRMLAIALISTVFSMLVYTRPMTVEELCPGVDLSKCETIHGYYSTVPLPEDTPFAFERNEAEFLRIMEQFKGRKFSRSLRNLLPPGTKVHRYQEGDFKWDVQFRLDQVSFPDGSTGSGDIVQFRNFFGTLELFYAGDTWRCDTSNLDQWLSDVMLAISDCE